MDDPHDGRLAQLSLVEKVPLLAGADTWHTVGVDQPPIAAIRMSDGPAGVRGTSWTGPASASFPCGAALGATFDVGLVAEVGRALAREAHTKGAHVVLGPTLNLQRTPIGGRNFECYSEDPFLTAEIAVAYVSGLQEAVPGRTRVAACVKHLVANDTEHERMTISVEVAENVLREVYLAPFEAAVVRGGARAVMSAYNRLNGTFCAEHRWLLTDVLRGDWSFDGLVVSDWFGCHSTAESLRAGLDLEMPGPTIHRGSKLLAAVEHGDVPEDDIDRAAGRVLALEQWVDAAVTSADEVTAVDDATRDVIRRAAIAGTVLLKNEGAALPLPPHGTLALIGPYAEHGRMQGGGSARVRTEARPGPRQVLSELGYRVTFEPGPPIAKYVPVLDGDYEVEFFDDTGAKFVTSSERLRWYWDEPPAPAGEASPFAGPSFGATVTGSFVPPTSGWWELGAHSVGPSRVWVGDTLVVEVPAGERGGGFFGLGSQEVRGRIELEGGRRYDLRVEYPPHPDQLVRGLAVGAWPVPGGDPVGRAAAAARRADVAVVVVGTDDDWETEGEDRTSLSLPGGQDELVAAVAAANPNTVVVVNAGSPVTMPWLDDVPAVLQLWFPGQELGPALADVLTGRADPGGRLPITFPRRLEDTPAAAYYPGAGGTAEYGEGFLVGHRWYDRAGVEPLFPFGHGLSYTSFRLHPHAVGGRPSVGVRVSIDVANTGERAGTSVVLVYVEPVSDEADRPVRTLAGFAKVSLAPGAVERVEVEVAPRAFSRWDTTPGATGWTVATGEYRLLVGASSRDLAIAGRVSHP